MQSLVLSTLQCSKPDVELSCVKLICRSYPLQTAHLQPLTTPQAHNSEFREALLQASLLSSCPSCAVHGSLIEPSIGMPALKLGSATVQCSAAWYQSGLWTGCPSVALLHCRPPGGASTKQQIIPLKKPIRDRQVNICLLGHSQRV